MKFIGVDLSAQPKNTSVCVLEWQDNPRVIDVHRPACDEWIIRATDNSVSAIGLDSPFGWPGPFVSFLQGKHKNRSPYPLRNAEADCLKYRVTDRWVRDYFSACGKKVQPLSVATDKLGAVALRCVRLVRCLVEVRGDQSTIFEVYPAASLASWMTVTGSYKASSNKQSAAASRSNRNGIVDKLINNGVDIATFRDRFVASHDDLDALVSALTAAFAFKGKTHLPPTHLTDIAYSEGWIHLPSEPLCALGLLAFDG